MEIRPEHKQAIQSFIASDGWVLFSEWIKSSYEIEVSTAIAKAEQPAATAKHLGAAAAFKTMLTWPQNMLRFLDNPRPVKDIDLELDNNT